MTKYIKIENNNPIEYSIEQLLEDHPGCQICDIFLGEIDNKLLEKYNVFPLVECPPIDGDHVQEGIPILVNGRWSQTWVAIDEE
jgi:hypothetical protein